MSLPLQTAPDGKEKKGQTLFTLQRPSAPVACSLGIIALTRKRRLSQDEKIGYLRLSSPGEGQAIALLRPWHCLLALCQEGLFCFVSNIDLKNARPPYAYEKTSVRMPK